MLHYDYDYQRVQDKLLYNHRNFLLHFAPKPACSARLVLIAWCSGKWTDRSFCVVECGVALFIDLQSDSTKKEARAIFIADSQKNV